MFAVVSFVPDQLIGSDIEWRSFGLRGGISDHRNDEDFQQNETFATWRLPWFRQWDSGWTLGTYLDANAGMLRGGGATAFVGSFGPGIYVTGMKGKIDVAMGINPTIISRHEFGDEDLGGPIQFTSHIDLNFNLVRHFTFGYRLQHMSNAVIYDENPGLNLHMIGIGYRF